MARQGNCRGTHKAQSRGTDRAASFSCRQAHHQFAFALQAGCLTAGGHQAIQVACHRRAAQGCKRTQRAGQASLVGGATDVGWRAAIASCLAAAVVGAGAGVAVAAGVSEVAQQHICTSQASCSSHSGVLLSDFGTRATRANRFQKRLGQHG